MSVNQNNKQPENFTEKIRSLFGFGVSQDKKDALPPKSRFNTWFFLFIFLFFAFLQPYFFSAKVETIPYSQFKQDLAEGKVAQLTIDSENITGTLTGPPNQEFSTVRVNDPGLVQELDERKVSYSGRYQNKFLSSLLSWIFPLGIMFLI